MTAFRPTLRRFMHVAHVAAKHGVLWVLAVVLRRWPAAVRWAPSAAAPAPDRLRAFFEELGGTFVKFGQMLALQPDVLSLEYCNALYNLLDRVAPCEYSEIERIFVDETGRSPEQVFDSFDREPLATASIGQVHVAWMDGRKVAVKVHRPNVDREFGGDISLMRAMLTVIQRLRLVPLYWMIEPLEEFVAWTCEELDYRTEARYLDRMRRNASDNAHERIPQVFWRYTTRRTLVTEFLDGVTVLDHLRALGRADARVARRLRDRGFDPNRFACHIIDNFLHDAYRHGLFHADLHPANLMILPHNVVGYVDFGITGVLSGDSRRNLIALTLAYTRGDLDGMAAAFIRGAALGGRADPTAFRAGLERLSASWYQVVGNERRVRKSFTLVMLDMLRLSRESDVWPERDVIKYIRSAIAIDGLIKRFAPAFDVARYLEGVCERYLRWEVRRALLSYDALIHWSDASGRLLRDGVLRAASAVSRIAAGEWPAAAPQEPRDAVEPRRLRSATSLTLVVVASSALMATSGGQIQWGLTLFTAEALLCAAASALLLRTIRRLASPRPAEEPRHA